MTTKKKVGISLLALLCAGVVTASTVGISEHIKNSNSSTYTSIAAETNNIVINTTDNNGISLTAVTLSNELTANATYESSYSITATLDNEYAIDKTITWSLSWSGSDEVTDYVKLSSSTSESGEEITLYCYAAFDTQITLTATNGNVSSTCSLDYIARVSGYRMYVSYAYRDVQPDQVVDVDTTQNYCVSGQTTAWKSNGNLGLVEDGDTISYLNDSWYSLTYGTGTVEDRISDFDITITFADDVKASIESALGLSNASYNVMGTGYTSETICADDIFNAFFGSDVMTEDEYMSKVYNAVIDYYNSGTAIFKITFTGTGSLTNKDYTFDAWATLNPSAYYVSAANVALSSTSIYF